MSILAHKNVFYQHKTQTAATTVPTAAFDLVSKEKMKCEKNNWRVSLFSALSNGTQK